MSEFIFPVISDDEKRTKRLINIYSCLNSKQRSALKSILERQSNSIQNMKLFLEYCDKYNVRYQTLITLGRSNGPRRGSNKACSPTNYCSPLP